MFAQESYHVKECFKANLSLQYYDVIFSVYRLVIPTINVGSLPCRCTTVKSLTLFVELLNTSQLQ